MDGNHHPGTEPYLRLVPTRHAARGDEGLPPERSASHLPRYPRPGALLR